MCWDLYRELVINGGLENSNQNFIEPDFLAWKIAVNFFVYSFLP